MTFRLTFPIATLLAGVLAGTTLHAQEPYNEDEWYDPTDWFDGNNEEWDDSYEWWDEGRDDGEGRAYDDKDHYGWHYEWNPWSDEWRRTYGWYDEYYESDAYDEAVHGLYAYDLDSRDGYADEYGWHYDWDAAKGEWERDYGWHDHSYDNASYRYGEPASDTRSQQGKSDTDSRQRSSVDSQQRIAGTIDGFRKLDSRDEHTLVRLRLRDGRTRVVDLGSRVDPERLDLSYGDRVQIRGMRDRHQGREVLTATSIKIDGDRTRLRERSDEQGTQGEGSKAGSDTREASAQRSRDGQTFAGRLDGFKKTSLDGREERLLVRMTLEDGTRRIVDLGPSARLKDLDLEQGDHVSVRGERRTIDGRTVLVADRLRIEGQRAALHQGSSREGSKSSSTKSRTFAGRLDGFEKASLDGREGHLLVRMTLEDGDQCLVDLGPKARLEDLDMAEGDRVHVSGEPRTVDGRSVLVADRLRIDGERVGLESGSMPR